MNITMSHRKIAMSNDRKKEEARTTYLLYGTLYGTLVERKLYYSLLKNIYTQSTYVHIYIKYLKYLTSSVCVWCTYMCMHAMLSFQHTLTILSIFVLI